MVTDTSNSFYLFLNFLQVGQGINPLRAIFIALVVLLWLFCFKALFSRDKRKMDLKYFQKRKLIAGFVEKRSHPRISYPMFVLYRVLDARGDQGVKENSDVMLVSNARDLSQSGIFMEVKQDLPIGTRLELKLTLGGKAGSLYLQGCAIRTEWLSPLGFYAVGVALEQGSREDQEKLARFIEQEQRKENRA